MSYFATCFDQHGEVLQSCEAMSLDGLAEAARHPDAVGDVLIEETPPPDDSYRHDGIWVTKPPCPSPMHAWDGATKHWVYLRPLSELQAAKWSEMKAARTAAEFGHFTYNGMVFDGDVDAQRRLAGYISLSKSALAAGEPFSASFILADNAVVVLTAADFVGIEAAKVEAVAQAFAHAASLRAQIFAPDATEESVAAITWS